MQEKIERKHNKSIVPYARELRRFMTDEEKHLWYDYLRSYPVRFTKQKVLGRYIADFYCAKAKLVVELDGSEHYTEEGIKYDEKRTDYLGKYGITVMRISNLELNGHFIRVCESIDEFVKNAIKTEIAPKK